MELCWACTAGVNHRSNANNAEKTTALFIVRPPPDCSGGVSRPRRTLKTHLSWPLFVGVTAGAAAAGGGITAESIYRAPAPRRKLHPKVPKCNCRGPGSQGRSVLRPRRPKDLFGVRDLHVRELHHRQTALHHRHAH